MSNLLSINNHPPSLNPSLPLSDTHRTQWMFVALCCYLLSQGFTIPVLTIGPSWAVWPNLPDISLGVLLLTLLFTSTSSIRPSEANRSLFRWFTWIYVGFCFSYIIVTLLFTSLRINDIDFNQGAIYGAFQLYRLTQFICIFWITSRIPLTTNRIRTLNNITTLVLIFVCCTILLTFRSTVPTTTFAAHIPADLNISGAWGLYLRKSGSEGLGAIGYNHSYVAAQVFMLLSLRLHLSYARKTYSLNNLLILITIVAVFITGARSGFAGILFFALIIWIKKPLYILILMGIAVTIVTIQPRIIPLDDILPTLERQLTVLQASQADNLSGRPEIWQEHLDYLNKNFTRWIIGSGVGSTMSRGESNAHMLPLQIIVETGLIGLLGFSIFFVLILKKLWDYEGKPKPIFWMTVALLFSSITQETFYPVPAFGHFLGFYLCSVAIALRRRLPDSA